jgi:hypothetical protein
MAIKGIGLVLGTVSNASRNTVTEGNVITNEKNLQLEAPAAPHFAHWLTYDG